MNQPICSYCGKPMTSYYGLKCFHCVKPTARVRKVYNLLEALHYLNLKRPGLKDRIWNSIEILYNDTTIECPIDIYRLDTGDEELKEDIEMFFTEFPDANACLWCTSW